jgi:hypothetical protein
MVTVSHAIRPWSRLDQHIASLYFWETAKRTSCAKLYYSVEYTLNCQTLNPWQQFQRAEDPASLQCRLAQENSGDVVAFWARWLLRGILFAGKKLHREIL